MEGNILVPDERKDDEMNAQNTNDKAYIQSWIIDNEQEMMRKLSPFY